MSSGPVTELPLSSIVAYSDFEKQNEGINHHTGGAIVILEIKGVLYVLLVQRPEKGTWGGSWEMPGGSYGKNEDASIVDTAIRETEEETGFVFDRESILETVYRDTFRNPKYPEQNNATHYVVVKQKLDERPDIRYSTEHQNGGLFSEEELENLATCTDEEWTDGKGGKSIPRAKQQGELFMLLRKKQAIQKAFQAVKKVE